MKAAITLIIFIAFTVQAGAHASYIGYSGAPGSRGLCSQGCHPTRDFAPTVTVTGFPANYAPGQQYTVSVAHQSGSSIANFNCSVRIGTGSNNAGVLAAGTNTATYSHTLETNGIHWSSSNINSGNFIWTAPASGTGLVHLYWAGLQGSLSTGADTNIVLTSSEAVTEVNDQPQIPDKISLSQNYPNPFNSETIVDFSISQSGKVDFEITNILGQIVYNWSSYVDQPGKISIHWNGKDNSGNDLSSGVYFYNLYASDINLCKKMVLLR